METKASFVIVGAFVLSFFVAIVAAIVWIADVDIDSDTVLYDIFFEGSVSGLSVGNPVRYGGIPIGIVTDMRISPDRFGEIQVIVEVPQDTPIREDAVARLEYQGITGVGFIQINGGTESADPLTPKAGQDRAEIRSEKSALQQVFDTAPEIVENLEHLTSQATKLFSDDNIKQMQGTLQNINRFSGALSDSSEEVEQLLQEGAATMAQFSSMASEAQRLVTAFANRAEGIAGETEGTIIEAHALVQDIRNFTENLDRLMLDVQPILAKADTTVGSYAALGEDMRGEVARLSNDLAQTIQRMDTAIASTDQHVAVLLDQAGDTLAVANTMLDTATTRIETVSDASENTLGAYEELADSVAPMVSRIADDATVAVSNLGEISGELRAAAVSIAGAADEAKELIAENRAPVTNFSSTGLYEFTQLLSEMRILVSSLTRITTQIERDPAQFFFGDSQQGYEVK